MEFLPEEFDFGNINEMPPFKRDYAAAKRDAEHAIFTLGSHGNSVSVARCFAFVGKYLPRHQHFAIGNFINDGLIGKPIHVKANFPVYRSYMYSDDLVNWLMTICEKSNLSCPIYNVGSDEALTIVELAGLIASRFSVEVHKSEITQQKVDRYTPSIEKAKKDLGLTLTLDLKSAIDRTIEDILMSNPYA